MEEKKYIRFIDSSYNTKFMMEDGANLIIKSSYDGIERKHLCKYLDECHTQIDDHCFHICQFAEIMERNGNTYRPEHIIREVTFYPKIYLIPVGEQSKSPYYVIDETPAGGFACCPTSRKAHQYCIFQKDESGTITSEQEFFSSIKAAAPAAHGLNLKKIKEITGYGSKKRGELER